MMTLREFMNSFQNLFLLDKEYRKIGEKITIDRGDGCPYSAVYHNVGHICKFDLFRDEYNIGTTMTIGEPNSIDPFKDLYNSIMKQSKPIRFCRLGKGNDGGIQYFENDFISVRCITFNNVWNSLTDEMNTRNPIEITTRFDVLYAGDDE